MIVGDDGFMVNSIVTIIMLLHFILQLYCDRTTAGRREAVIIKLLDAMMDGAPDYH